MEQLAKAREKLTLTGQPRGRQGKVTGRSPAGHQQVGHCHVRIADHMNIDRREGAMFLTPAIMQMHVLARGSDSGSAAG